MERAINWHKAAHLISCFCLVSVFFLLIRPVSADSAETGPAVQSGFSESKIKALEEKWGVRPTALRLTGSNYFVDFRYVITDPEKAKTVLARNKENSAVYLLVQKTGEKFPVPVTKIGPLRSTTVSPKMGRQYTVLFSNVKKSLKKGDKVTIVIGNFKAENLRLE